MNAFQHLSLQERLLNIEYEAEKHEYEEFSRQIGIHRRIRQGKCWYPVGGGRTFYNALNQLCIEIVNTSADPTLVGDYSQAQKERTLTPSEHEFEPGRPVVFFRTEGDGDRPLFWSWSCQISRVDGMRMLVSIPGTQTAEILREYARLGQLGVQLSFDATSHRVMCEAIHQVLHTDNARLQHLRNVLLGDEHATFRVEQPLSLPWLNPSQQEAVMHVVCAREVAIVHGPPGTGKTTTLVEAISETLRRETQILVCAQSNAAVDWIAEQLLARGISVLRVGNPMRVSDNLLEATYERRYEAHPDYTELWAIRKAEREAIARLSSKHCSGNERHSVQNMLNKLRSHRTELEIRINDQLFAQSRVIACTLIGTSSRVLERKHFSTLFIDEAAQAFEAACWAAIQKADRVILAGDHHQLPPTIKSIDAERQGLGTTLMEYVAQRRPESVRLLTVQYRMHEQIMQFSSDWFYKGMLQAAPEVAHRTVIELDSPLVWIDTSRLGFEEQTNPLSQSKLNTNEGLLLIRTLRDYVRQLGMQRILDEQVDFGIISPYKSQVQLLRKLVRQSNYLKPLQGRITVHTVDGFQGQERDVILISMVRGNDDGRIGFLNDLRRMNVAITRARMKLIVLGDTTTLSCHPFYHNLIEHFSNHGKMIIVEPDPDTEPSPS
ncbi:MAG: AAA family ATPase [Bacteroidales bacterium]|nr:AAA family ATPase [Bacteroidales bacterium]